MVDFDQIYEAFERLKATEPSDAFVYCAEKLNDHIWIGIEPDQKHCILLIGGEIEPKLARVKGICSTGSWTVKDNEEQIAGLKLSFESEPEFQTLTSAITWALLSGLAAKGSKSLPKVFAETERMIEILIQKSELSQSWFLGLFGELHILEQILRRIWNKGLGSKLPSDTTFFWSGSTQGARDIMFGSTVVEIKTTRTDKRRHHFHGFSQLEPKDSSEELFVLSQAFEPSKQGISSQKLIKKIRELIMHLSFDPNLANEKFDERWKSYIFQSSTSVNGGLDQGTQVALDRCYEIKIVPKIFKMSDPNLPVLRRSYFQSLDWMREERLECEIEFGDSVPGSPDNPRYMDEFLDYLEKQITDSCELF